MNFDNDEEIIRSITGLLEGLDYIIHRHGDLDDEYRYLCENEMCITVKNTFGEDAVYIDLADELTLTFGAWHGHYDYSDEDYNEMSELLKDYLEGRICTLEIYSCESDGLKWVGSCNLTAEECELMLERKLIKKFIKKFIDKENWPIKCKAIFRFFDEKRTKTCEFSLGDNQ